MCVVCVCVHVDVFLSGVYVMSNPYCCSGNTEYSYRYQGMLDVDHLLQAVGLHPMPSLQLVSIIVYVVVGKLLISKNKKT